MYIHPLKVAVPKTTPQVYMSLALQKGTFCLLCYLAWSFQTMAYFHMALQDQIEPAGLAEFLPSSLILHLLPK
jgi:hypothetical protein